MVFKCSEGDKLWAAFVHLGEDWHKIHGKTRKNFKRQGTIGLCDDDVKRIKKIEDRLKRTRRLFTGHIEKHRC
jgi:hypothetical protein